MPFNIQDIFEAFKSGKQIDSSIILLWGIQQSD